MLNRYKTYAMILTMIGILSGCGGISFLVSEGRVQSVGQEANTGTVNGFRSVYINGTRYDTGDALVKSDKLVSNDRSELKFGMRVSFAGGSSKIKSPAG